MPSGQVDASFGTNGSVTHTYPALTSLSVDNFVRLGDGRLLVGGTANDPTGRMYLARFMADGSSDASFNSTGSHVYQLEGPSAALGMALQPDGRIVLAGWTTETGVSKLALLRTAADGTPDPTFGVNGIAVTDLGFTTQELHGLVLLPDGGILACGMAEISATDQDALLVQFDATGALDPNFGDAGLGWITKDHLSGFDAYADVVLDSEGLLLALGHVHVNPGSSLYEFQLLLDRYYLNGDPEGSFGNEGSTITDHPFGATPHRAVLQPDGKILVCGRKRQFLSDSPLLARFIGGGPVSVAELATRPQLLPYPNPASSELSLKLPLPPQEWEVRFVDIGGRTVRHERLSGTTDAVWPLAGLAAGTYQVVLQAAGVQYRTSFVKLP